MLQKPEIDVSVSLCGLLGYMADGTAGTSKGKLTYVVTVLEDTNFVKLILFPDQENQVKIP